MSERSVSSARVWESGTEPEPKRRRRPGRRDRKPEEGRDYFVHAPVRLDRNAPMLVVVHGIQRRAEQHLRLVADLADQRGAIAVAPLFPQAAFRGYQRLAGRRRRPDIFLERVVDSIAERYGVEGASMALLGYSGGAQFAHRYALVNPRRVGSLVVVAAGSYTLPRRRVAYPLGTAPSERYPHVRCRLRSFLQIPIRVAIGEQDVLRDDDLNRDAEVEKRLGSNRVERATRWVRMLHRAARKRGLQPTATLDLLPGAGHSFEECIEPGGLLGVVEEALF